MAYADGELTPRQRADVEALLAQRPELRERLAAFALTGRSAYGRLRSVAQEPVPAHLKNLVLTAPTGMPREQAQARSWSVPRLLDALFPSPGVALAYCGVLLAGFGAGILVNRAPTTKAENLVSTTSGGSLVAHGALRAALEGTPSGGKEPVRVRLSFKGKEGFCRQYEFGLPSGGSAAGVACRDDAGIWSVPLHVTTSAPLADRGRQRPAGVGAVEKGVQDLMQGDAFDATEERQLIARGWRQ
jgi:hypothetical protein